MTSIWDEFADLRVIGVVPPDQSPELYFKHNVPPKPSPPPTPEHIQAYKDVLDAWRELWFACLEDVESGGK